VAETFAHRISVYDLADDGSLGNRRCFAQFGDDVDPDGICLDPEGDVWLATATKPEVLRVADGGAITGRVELSSGLTSYTVALGGIDGATLFICSSAGIEPTDPRRGRIEIARVE
jgi:sugar lactone lactonase YvrE